MENQDRHYPAINAGKGPGLNVMCGYSRAAGLACLRTDNEMVSRIWDVRTGTIISELRGHLSPGDVWDYERGRGTRCHVG